MKRNKENIKKHFETGGRIQHGAGELSEESQYFQIFKPLSPTLKQWRIYFTGRYMTLAQQIHILTCLAYNKGQINQIMTENKGCPADFGAKMTSRAWPRMSRYFTYAHSFQK